MRGELTRQSVRTTRSIRVHVLSVLDCCDGHNADGEVEHVVQVVGRERWCHVARGVVWKSGEIARWAQDDFDPSIFHRVGEQLLVPGGGRAGGG
jgi:hypothetical protein